MYKDERVILHIDINHCYAQIEEMLHPAYRDIAMAVGGSEKERHGIILAKNLKAKPFQISTAEPIRSALKKCPDLLIIPPDMKKYQYYTALVKSIFYEYSDQIEDFGLDEAWVDVSASQSLFGDGMSIAKEIQDRVLSEYGLTVSIGVSFNKVFAKLASDIKKPSGLIEISKDNYKEVAWNRKVEELLMVGKSTTKKLHELNILTIGDLATTSIKLLDKHFGKTGMMLWNYANGVEHSDVDTSKRERAPKSVSNSWTAPKDIVTYQDARLVLERLSNSVATRMRGKQLIGNVITLSLRDVKLSRCTRQKKLDYYTDISKDMFYEAFLLLLDNYDFSIPLRSIGVAISNLKPAADHCQLNLFEDETEKLQNRSVEITIENIREKYGFFSIDKASALLDRKLSKVNPRGDHIAFARTMYKGSDER